jgi:hypothetical protein
MTNEQLGTPDTLSKKHLPWSVAAIAITLVLLGLIINNARYGAVSPRIRNPNDSGGPHPLSDPLFGYGHWIVTIEIFSYVALVSIVALIVVLWRRYPKHPYLLMTIAVTTLAWLDAPMNWVTFAAYNPDLWHWPEDWPIARQQLLGHRLARGHLELTATLGTQRRQSGVDALRDIEYLVRPFGDDLARRVSWVPRVVRVTRRTPTWASIEVSRAETACWLIPTSRLAALKLPVLAIADSTSSAESSGIRALNATPDRSVPATRRACIPARTRPLLRRLRRINDQCHEYFSKHKPHSRHHASYCAHHASGIPAPHYGRRPAGHDDRRDRRRSHRNELPRRRTTSGHRDGNPCAGACRTRVAVAQGIHRPRVRPARSLRLPIRREISLRLALSPTPTPRPTHTSVPSLRAATR